MTSVGLILKAERERQGRELAEIAEELCLTQRYVCAIEQDDLEVLPGIFFYKSFVKQYAAMIGIDQEALKPAIQELTRASEPPIPEPGSKQAKSAAIEQNRPIRDLDPIVRDGNRRYLPDTRMGRSFWGLIAVMVVCSAFYAWWTKLEQPVARSAPPVIAAIAPAVVAVPAAAPAPPAPVNTPTVDVTASTSADDPNHVVLSLSATEATWLSITSEGKQIFSGVLEPSETKTLTATEAAKLKVGNAGGLEVLWNGKPIGPIGPRGQVRVVLFTPDNFQILNPSQAL